MPSSPSEGPACPSRSHLYGLCSPDLPVPAASFPCRVEVDTLFLPLFLCLGSFLIPSVPPFLASFRLSISSGRLPLCPGSDNHRHVLTYRSTFRSSGGFFPPRHIIFVVHFSHQSIKLNVTLVSSFATFAGCGKSRVFFARYAAFFAEAVDHVAVAAEHALADTHLCRERLGAFSFPKWSATLRYVSAPMNVQRPSTNPYQHTTVSAEAPNTCSLAPFFQLAHR